MHLTESSIMQQFKTSSFVHIFKKLCLDLIYQGTREFCPACKFVGTALTSCFVALHKTINDVSIYLSEWNVFHGTNTAGVYYAVLLFICSSSGKREHSQICSAGRALSKKVRKAIKIQQQQRESGVKVSSTDFLSF